MLIRGLIRKGDSTEELFKALDEEDRDLLIMLAQEERYLEHFLFGRGKEKIIPKMPCPVLLDKKERGAARFRKIFW
ncbi:MAG: universal stress protein [Dissulfurispiraceae bacterium]